MTENWIILGATSSMARAFARRAAQNGARVFLAGRDIEDLKRQASDCRLRGAELAEAFSYNAREPSSCDALIERVMREEGVINVAVFIGSMPEQADIDSDPGLIAGVVVDNYSGPATFLQKIIPLMEERGGGCVVGVGSVAGDRGRIGNYVYGSAKAGFHTYLSGLRNRLTKAGGHVVTVKPGFVDTAMTWGIEGMFLVATPEKIAADIWRAVEKRRNLIYTPGFWRVIMGIIKRIPEPIFKKMSI